MQLYKLPALLLALFCVFSGYSQDSASIVLSAHTTRLSAGKYEIHFSIQNPKAWQIYAPGQDVSGTPSASIDFSDSATSVSGKFTAAGPGSTIHPKIFDNAAFSVLTGNAEIVAPVTIAGTVPAHLLGTLNFAYGRGDEFYTGAYPFTVDLEGGVASETQIIIPSFDLKHPVSSCGDEGTEGKGLMSIFLLGLAGGLIALLTPCVFPLVPLTVSFFTKQGGTGSRGWGHALLYAFFIFLIYLLLSLPFHLLDHVNPEILNNISTNIWLNLSFFVIFVVFAISFFGYFDITLPGSVANSVNNKSSGGTLAGIFFMALTLAIVSFSCTGPILGSLLAGSLSNHGGAIQLTVGMGGFGLGLALPFGLFALFPGWLNSLPKSGGWLTTVKVVLGFLELAMAMKFLSQADLVKQWGLIKREYFIGIWVIIGVLLTLYLMGKIRFPHDSPVKKLSPVRIGLIVFFAAATIYLLPGLTNTRSANLKLISGIAPPLCYSAYKDPVNCPSGKEPLQDYQAALDLAKKLKKPLLIDFTGWACTNCRRMEEKVWTDPAVRKLMQEDFVVVSLYVDERRVLPAGRSDGVYH